MERVCLTLLPLCDEGGVKRYRSTAIKMRVVLGAFVAVAGTVTAVALTVTGVSSAFPSDAVRMPFVGDWHYYSRPRGMLTSSDDVLVATVACSPQLVFGERGQGCALVPPMRYCDLGCGIGSSLLLVAHASRPNYSLGVEVQEVSYQMVSRAVRELPEPPCIEVVHADLRSLSSPLQPFDLVTANPPYLPASSGTRPADAQRSMARFELHGGVEDYCLAAQRLLSRDGRFVLACWYLMRDRVERAAARSGLNVGRRLDVIGGAHGATTPHLSIWELHHCDNPPRPVVEATLDITRTAAGGLNPAYKALCAAMNMRPRPLQPRGSASPRTGIRK